MGAAADAILYHKLCTQIPRLHLTALIVRVAQTLLIFSLSSFYALSGPEMFQDVFIWESSLVSDPPYNFTIHRNFHRHWSSSEMGVAVGDVTQWPKFIVQWNLTGPPMVPGLSEAFWCPQGWLGCTGIELAATRLSWLDSWPTEGLPRWLSGVVYLDRYIFWCMIVGGFLAVGHNLTVFAHAIEPSGIGFYKYIAGMDFLVSLIFLLLGVFPLSVLNGLKDALPDKIGTDVVGLDQYIWDLEPSQKYAFVLGWIMWGLYATSGILNCAMVVGIHKYKRLRAPVKQIPIEDKPTSCGVLDVSPLREPVPLVTGFDGGYGSLGHTISRHGGQGAYSSGYV